MKKSFVKIVALLTMSILLISNVTIFAAENNFRGNEKHKHENQLKEYVREGEISEIYPNKIVFGEKSNKVLFRVTKNTTIKDEKQNEIKLSDLKVGMNVEVTYNRNSNGRSEKSFEAISIKVTKNVDQISKAVVQEVSVETKNTLLLTILYETTDSKNRIVENTMNLVVDNNTEIVNQFGVETEKSVLKAGMVLDVQHSKAVTKSYVPQAYCDSINIVKENEDSEIIETKIIEKNIYNNVAYVLVGNPEKVNEQIKLVLSNETLLKDQDGNDITYKELKVGQIIKAEYSLAMTRSLPAQAYAYSVQILDEKTVPNIENATIENIDLKNNRITVIYEEEYNNKIYEETIVLLIDKDTVLKNEFGKTIAITDLEVGMLINATHSDAVTLSIPPTAKAYLIEVIDDKETVSIENTTIENIDLKNNRITVIYEEEYNNKIYEETIILLVDKDTVLKNESGKSIAITDLKVGMLINATHSNAVTLGIPPTAKVYLIEVVDDKESVSIKNATIESVDVKNTRITVTYEEKYNNKIYEETIVLLVDKNTIIEDTKGKAITLKDLKVGMIIDATHSQSATLSMPPMTLAYSINVKSSTVPPIDNEFGDIYDLLDKIFKELGVDNWYEYIKDSNIDWDFDDDDDLEDIIEEIVEHVLDECYDDDDRDDDDMEDEVEDLIEKLIKEFKGIDKNIKNNKNKKN